MPLIEGIGDEVTIGFTVFVLLCLILLAWFSTHTREIPFVSIIVVELSQRRILRNAGTNATTSSSNGEDSSTLAHTESDNDIVPEVASGSGDCHNNNAELNEGGELSSRESDTGSNAGSSSANALPAGVKQATCSVPTSQQEPISANLPDILCSGSTVSAGPGGHFEENQQPASPSDVSAPVALGLTGGEDVSSLGVTSLPTEVRRRRVAYFESARNKGSFEGRGANVSSLGAESVTEYIGPENDQQNGNTEVSSLLGLSEASGKETCTKKAKNEARPSEASTSQEPLNVAPTVEASAAPSESERVASNLTTSNDATEPANNGQQIRVRLKYLNDTQRLVFADPQETVGNFRQLHFSPEIQDNKIVRFIFNGQDLRNDLSTLQSYNIADNSVIHCLITQSRQNDQPSHNHHAGDDETQMGDFLYPVFGLILGLVWYLRFTYKQYFNAMSTVSLAGVSFLYLLAFFSTIRHRRQPHQHLE